jgi:hypothetical protein
MPLSASTPRQHMHTREINCRGYARDDGLWDIEAHLKDTKTYAFANASRGTINPGEPLHEMWLRLTLDEGLNIHEVEAATDYGPYTICGDITPEFAKLKGLQIGRGWMRKVRAQVGGVHGCTHLVELLQTLATVAFQTLSFRDRKEKPEAADSVRTQPPHINTCHALRSDGPVVEREWSEFYTGS